MEAIVKNGKLISGKVAELFVKIGIATPTDGVKKVKPVARPVKKPAEKKVPQVKTPVVLLTEVKTDFVEPGKQHVFKLKAKK